jgi:NADP-dependent alcohol dehydrogenase
MGMDTKSDYTKDYDKTADFIVNRFDERGWKGLEKSITLDKVKSIVEMSY